MSDPRGRIDALALRVLDEQDRQVGDPRGRLAPVVAAGGSHDPALKGVFVHHA
jgi:hypothetical protein